jgi:beta-glucosidase
VLGRAETLGAAKKGMYAFIKHFALNDQETHRDQLGLVTWANEQSIREIYLKPFEMCIKDFSVTIDYNEPVRDENNKITGYVKKQTQMPATFGVMSSFNRIGTTWAGGNYNLISGVLRKEWGYNGFVLTDYEVNSYMVTNQTLAAGGDAKLKTVDMSSLFGTSYDLAENPAYQGYAREAAHHILYTIVNSAAMNGYVHGRVFINGFAYYKIFLIVFDVLATAGVALLGVVIYKKLRRKNN